ncbi:MAG: HEAT repeat domain-containing protein [Terriglobales bacterium]
MSAAALFRICLALLISSVLAVGQSQSDSAEPNKTATDKKESSSSSSKTDNTQTRKTLPEPVTIPNPSLPPVDGAWQLLETGVNSDKPGEREIAMHAIGLIRNSTHARYLAERGLDDEKPEVRAAAATTLGTIGMKTSIPKLKQMLDDKDNKVVLSAAQALISLRDEDGYQVYYEILTGERKNGTGLIASQEAMLKDPKRLFDLGFHEGLGFVPFGGISYEAFKTITKDDVTPLRAAAAKKLAQDPDPDTTKGLIKATGDKQWLVRAAALEALALRGDPSAAKTASLYVYDDRDEVRYTAAAAVIRLSAKEKKKAEQKEEE